DPSFETLDRILRHTGSRLIAVPTTRTTASDASAEIAGALERGDVKEAFAVLVRYNDDLVAERGAGRLALALTPPVLTGRAEWDAAIAGVTEYRLNHTGIPLPDWTRGVRAPSATVVSGSKRSAPINHDDVPPELLARNVLIDRAVLQMA
ncbi:MAG: XRE family transcriptional regulator, partial [Rhodoglobus sp.]|nr:XRE family transcriptional regulator [Rhodoglobus sp.]